MDFGHWFSNQLQASADGLLWGIEQVPQERRNIVPPIPLGTWTAIRHVFHMAYYEQTIALPSMKQWLGSKCPTTDDLNEDAAWAAQQNSIEILMDQFREIRAQQIQLLRSFSDADWKTPHQTVWGAKDLLWVVSKTYQHTAEHTSDILCMALFWDFAAAAQEDSSAHS
ncbi:MAG: DinB family protein [Ktedonobacterales bacterium]